MDLNKYTGVQKIDIVHSNGYARQANGENFGATKAQSMAERMRLAQQKARHVHDYRRSGIGAQVNGRPRQAMDVFSKRNDNSNAPNIQGGRQMGGSGQAPPARGFQEPARRNYNPYS